PGLRPRPHERPARRGRPHRPGQGARDARQPAGRGRGPLPRHRPRARPRPPAPVSRRASLSRGGRPRGRRPGSRPRPRRGGRAPGTAVILGKRSDYLLELGELAEAIADADKAIAIEPVQLPTLYYNRAAGKRRLAAARREAEPDREEPVEERRAWLTEVIADL